MRRKLAFAGLGILIIGIIIIGFGAASYYEYQQCQLSAINQPGIDNAFFCNIISAKEKGELGIGVGILAVGGFVLTLGLKGRALTSTTRGPET